MDTKPLPQRKSPRLQAYDYSKSGAYFITFCSYKRVHYFGEISSGQLKLNSLGNLAYTEITKLPHYWRSIDIDLFVVMPNHIHFIIVLHEKSSDIQRLPTTGDIVRNYKSGVTRLARRARLFNETSPYLWQGRYHDHIIRNERELNYVRNYVATNPERWEQDRFYS